MTTSKKQPRTKNNIIDRNISVTKAARFTILILLAALAFLIAAQKEPLKGMHWDVPNYLYQAKRFTETHYLVNYAQHAADALLKFMDICL